MDKLQQLLQEGQAAFGAHWYDATAKHYHGVNNFDGPLESSGPRLNNDHRLLERHIQRLSDGRPSDVVVMDLLERSSKKTKNKSKLTQHLRSLRLKPRFNSDAPMR